MASVTPHALDAERAVLGAALISNAAFPVAVSVVSADDFFRRAHQEIFLAMGRLADRGTPIDEMTVCLELRAAGELDECGGPAYVSGLTEGVPKTANVKYYALAVRESAKLRDVIDVAVEVQKQAHEPDAKAAQLVDDAVSKLSRLTSTADDVSSSKAAIDSYLDRLIAGTAKPVLQTGYLDLDILVGGFNASDLIIVAARPGIGKTSFALGVAQHMASMGSVVPFFSLEMPERQIAARLLSWKSGVPVSTVDRGHATEDDFIQMAEARAVLPEIPLFIQSTARTVAEISGWCRRIAHEQGKIDCVVIDYLQLLSTDRHILDKEERISSISASLKRLAIDLDITVVALSQLNRDSDDRRDKRPQLSDLRGSGALEQDSNMAILLFREEVYVKRNDNAGIAEVIVSKNRNGPTGTVRLMFDAQFARFKNLARG